MDFLQKHLEALIFCAEDPVSAVDLGRCLSEMFDSEIAQDDVLEALEDLKAKYQSDEYVFHIVALSGGYQFLTKAAYQPSISILLKHKSKKRLSTSALETLSIVAYKQPITKAQIEAIRGVNSDYAIQRLLERELVAIKGKSDGPGRPMLYGSGKKFMDYFGIMDLSELPQPKDFVAEDAELGPKEEA
jgi:segregation and condensation protein B